MVFLFLLSLGRGTSRHDNAMEVGSVHDEDGMDGFERVDFFVPFGRQ